MSTWELKEEPQGKQKSQSELKAGSNVPDTKTLLVTLGSVYHGNNQISDKDHCILYFLSPDSFHIWFTRVLTESRGVQPVYNWSKTAMNHALKVLFTAAANTL